MNSNWNYSPEVLNSGKNWQFFVPCDLEIWRMTFKNNRTPFSVLLQALCIILWQPVNSNQSYSPEMLNSGESRRFFVPCDLEIWFVHNFEAISQFKLELPSGNCRFGSNSAILVPCDGWHWKTIGYLFKLCASFDNHRLIDLNKSYSPETPNLGQIRCFFVPCDLEFWRMISKYNRAPLLFSFKLCAPFRSHL